MTFPIAIDYRFPVAHYHNSEPLPPVPEGWTRLLAEDYSAGDEWEDVPVDVPAILGHKINDDGTTQDELSEILPATVQMQRRQTASGLCREYQLRADEWSANRPKPDDTEQRRAALLADLAAKRYALEVGGFDYMGKRVMSDRESQAKIQGLMVGVQLLGDAFKTSWKCEGGEWLDLDKNGALSLVAAALTHVSRLYTQEAALSARIKAATTNDEIKAIAQEGFQ